MIRAVSLWLPVAIYMAAIFWASSLHVLPGAVSGFPDWLLHSACYGGLALVSLRAVSGGTWRGVVEERGYLGEGEAETLGALDDS